MESTGRANEGYEMDVPESNDVTRRKKSMTSSTRRSSSSSKSSDLTNGVNTAIEVTVPRTVGLFGGISFIVGTMIGSGIFISPKGITECSGSVAFSLISWLICGLISMFGAFCYAELGTIIKESGADYVYLHNAFGPLVSYTFSFVNNILVKPASLATIALTCAQYIMVAIFNDGCGSPSILLNKLLSVFIILLLASINVYSAVAASRIQVIFTVAKLAALAIIIIGGIVKLFEGFTENLATGFEGTESNPGKIAVGFYSGMWAYDGWNTANFITEEIIKPERNLPLAIIIGVPLVIVVYVLTNISYFTVMSVQELIASPAVAITWAERVIPSVSWLIPVFVAASTFGTGNGSLFSGIRLIFASARNDHLPEVLAMVHVRKFTPVPATVLTVVLGIIFVIPGDIGSLIDFISFLSWIFYGMNMFAVIVFRFSKKYKDLHRPVRMPLFIPVIGVLSSAFLVLVPIITNPQIEFLFAAIFIVIGFIFYVPLVHFKLDVPFMKYVTMFFQLLLQSSRPLQTLE